MTLIQIVARVLLGLMLAVAGLSALGLIALTLYGHEQWEKHALIEMGMPTVLLIPLLGVALIGLGAWLVVTSSAKPRRRNVR